MPRNGSGVYSHPFPDVVEGTTIESAVFNGNTSDVEQDLNTPRPIVAGGTGANNAHDAMVALSGEIANQGDVRNYATFPFVGGSFYSSPGATDAPLGSTDRYFIGIAYAIGVADVVIEAREFLGITPTRTFVRQKSAGTWGPWTQQAGSTADLDAAYVNVAGDTMTGWLRVNGSTVPWPFATRVAADKNIGIFDWSGAVALGAMNDAGAAWVPMAINASLTTFEAGPLKCVGEITAGFTGAGGSYYFGNSGTKYLTYDGANFTLAGGPLFVTSSINASSNITATGGGAVVASGEVYTGQANAASGLYRFGNNGTKYLQCNGTDFILAGGLLNIYDNLWINRGATTGIIQFGNTGTKYLNFDGSTIWTLNGGNLLVNGDVNSTGSIISRWTLGSPSYNLDATVNTSTVAHTALIAIVPSFSGMVLLTNWTSGITELFVCGAGAVVRVSGSSGSTTVSVAYAPPQNGYAFYNQSGATATYGLMTFRTRSAA